MKLASLGLLLGGMLCLLLVGCGTDTPGVTNTLGKFTTNINGSPDKVTDAAAAACKDLGLAAVNSTHTKIDGSVDARTAQNSDVTIEIEQAGDNVSKVGVKVGSMGDESISRQIFERIKANLQAKPSAPGDMPGPTRTEPSYH